MKSISLNDFYSNVRQYIQIVLEREDMVISEKNNPVICIEPIRKENDRRPNIQVIDELCEKYNNYLPSSTKFANRKKMEIQN